MDTRLPRLQVGDDESVARWFGASGGMLAASNLWRFGQVSRELEGTLVISMGETMVPSRAHSPDRDPTAMHWPLRRAMGGLGGVWRLP